MASSIRRTLTRRRDHKEIGELIVYRSDQFHFVDDENRHLPTPVRADTIVVSIKAPDGEYIVWEKIWLERSLPREETS